MAKSNYRLVLDIHLRVFNIFCIITFGNLFCFDATEQEVNANLNDKLQTHEGFEISPNILFSSYFQDLINSNEIIPNISNRPKIILILNINLPRFGKSL